MKDGKKKKKPDGRAVAILIALIIYSHLVVLIERIFFVFLFFFGPGTGKRFHFRLSTSIRTE